MPSSHRPPDTTRQCRLRRVRRCEVTRPVLRRSASGGRTGSACRSTHFDAERTCRAVGPTQNSHRRTRRDRLPGSLQRNYLRGFSCENAKKIPVQSSLSIQYICIRFTLHCSTHHDPSSATTSTIPDRLVSRTDSNQVEPTGDCIKVKIVDIGIVERAGERVGAGSNAV